MAQQQSAATTTIVEPAMKQKRNSPPTISKVDSVMSNDSFAADTSGVEVRVLGTHEYKQAAYTLAEAFKDDDLAQYFVNTPDRTNWTKEQKWDLHLKIMEYITYAHLLRGLVVSAGPDYDCVALWMPPKQNMDDWWTIIRSGLWRLNWQLSREGRKRFFDEFFPLLHDTKAQILRERDDHSWYLVYIGTKTSGRGKGYAKKAVGHVLEKCDAEGRAAYLESSNLINRKIYGKMGFELKKNIYLQRADEQVVLDIMVREPVRKDAVNGHVKT